MLLPDCNSMVHSTVKSVVNSYNRISTVRTVQSTKTNIISLVVQSSSTDTLVLQKFIDQLS